jgi:hypothetical protein
MLILPLLVFGCGGSGGDSPSTTTVSGVVMAGPANGSSVTVKNGAGTLVAGPVMTSSNGSYTVSIPITALAADLIFEANGGTFPDEATGTAGVAMGGLSAHVPAGTLSSGVNLTIDPSSTIIRKMVGGGMTRTAAMTAFNSAFGYTPDSTVKPSFCNMSTASSDKERLAGLRAAAFSQLTMDLGLAPEKQFELIEALANDLSDSVLDGMKNGVAVTTASGTAVPEDIYSRFTSALMSYYTSARNKSDLRADRIGSLPFAKTALTTSYKVEYLPGTMAPVQGKSSFRIRLTNRSDNSPAAGKIVTLTPFMFMATKSHTTPADPVVDNGDGTYSCTVYYVMSTMMNGASMGIWQLKVTIGTESVNFYPTVAMPMGNTMLTKLSGVTDSILMPAGLEKRTYFLFRDGLAAGAGGYSFGIFLATKETLTNFPSVKVADQLKDQNGNFWTVSSIVMQVSTDGTNWISATDTGNGHWSVSGLTGLTSGVQGNVHVKLFVNNEQKTTNGFALDGTNGYQTFMVTP